MPFHYQRTARFADTDAAGVVFFANYLAFCHEAYEESLSSAGVPVMSLIRDLGVMVPIARSEVEYLRPIAPGDKVRISAVPESLSENTFAVRYEIHRLGPVEKLAARARTEHVCINPQTRARTPLPAALAAWVSAG